VQKHISVEGDRAAGVSYAFLECPPSSFILLYDKSLSYLASVLLPVSTAPPSYTSESCWYIMLIMLFEAECTHRCNLQGYKDTSTPLFGLEVPYPTFWDTGEEFAVLRSICRD